MSWQYRGHPVADLPSGVVGFVYAIHYTDGTIYIGKKLAKSFRKKKPLKDMRVNARRMVMTEHKWMDYTGSSKDTEGKTILSKVITHLCTNKVTMAYLETKMLMEVDATINKKYINKNIGGKYYDNCLEGLYEGPVNQGGLFDDE